MAECPDCGFLLRHVDLDGPAAGTPFAWHYDVGSSTDAGATITDGCRAAAEQLRTSGDDLRRSPQPGRWSPLEYACHIRDVLLVQRERVLKVMRGHGTESEPMGRDERALDDGYNEQSPENVAVQLEQSAILFVGLLDRLTDEQWDAELVYNFPTRIARSLRWVALHTAHEVVHHVADMRAQPPT